MADSDDSSRDTTPPDLLAVIGRGVVPPVLHNPQRRKEMGLPEDENTPGRYMVELNILYRGGLREASKAFLALFRTVLGETVIGPIPAIAERSSRQLLPTICPSVSATTP